MEIISLLVWIACAWGCYSIAENNGRNPTLAAFLGLFFGVFAVAGYAIAGKKD